MKGGGSWERDREKGLVWKGMGAGSGKRLKGCGEGSRVDRAKVHKGGEQLEEWEEGDGN